MRYIWLFSMMKGWFITDLTSWYCIQYITLKLWQWWEYKYWVIIVSSKILIWQCNGTPTITSLMLLQANNGILLAIIVAFSKYKSLNCVISFRAGFTSRTIISRSLFRKRRDTNFLFSHQCVLWMVHI